MPEVFVSYRRADQPLATALLADVLASEFGRDVVFLDVDSLVPGRPWAEGLTEALATSAVLVAVIGPGWLDAPAPDGDGRALDRPDDWVRREIVAALDRNLPVVPVLLEDTPRPPADRLPEELRPLSGIHDMRVRHRDRQADLDQLLRTLLAHIPALARRDPAPATPAPNVVLGAAQYRGSFPLPGSDSPLMGRSVQLTELRALLVSGSSGRRAPVVVVDGDVGIGKTRMALDVSADFPGSLVLPPAVGARPHDLDDLVVDRPTVLVVEDAHRSGRDLTGVAALIGDPAFDQVRVVLTARRGFAEEITERIGVHDRDVHTVTLDVLDRMSVDALVRSHGIEYEPFRRHIVNAAAGNPLIAHEACQVVTTSGRYTVTDTADILADFVKSRLRPGDPPHADVRRAVLTAVAVYAGSPAADRVGLCRLAPAISALPPNPHEIDSAVADLLEAGLIVELGRNGRHGDTAYGVHPEAAGPVVVHHAIHGAGRVRLNPNRALEILGPTAASDSPETGAGGSSARGVLGLPTPLPNTAFGLAVETDRLGSQLRVLTAAAHLGDDDDLGRLLGRAVRELLPPDADSWAWVEVLAIAGQVTSKCPSLLTDLHHSLIVRWPPPPGTDLFGDATPEVNQRRAFERLVRGVAEQVGHLVGLPPRISVDWLLDTAWLAYPALGELVHEQVRAAINSVGASRHMTTAETDEEFLDRRRGVVDAITHWWTQRTKQDPEDLSESERRLRSPEVATRVALAALEPFFSVLTSEIADSPQDADLYWWRHYVLPPHPGAADTMTAAVDLAITMVDQLTGPDPGSPTSDRTGVDALLWIVDRPHRMLGEIARGLEPERPLPDHAAAILHRAAGRLSRAIADRWDRLPLRVRHAAAVDAARQARRPTLVDAAAGGNPVAERVVADTELLEVATIFPIEHIPVWETGEASEPDRIRRAAAERFGHAIHLGAALALLDRVGLPPPPGWPSYLGDFVHSVGSRVADPAPLLERLGEGELLGGDALLTAAAATCPNAICRWLVERLGESHYIARLAVAAADALPPDDEPELLDLLDAAYVAEADTHADGMDSGGEVGRLVQMLALHLSRCRRGADERLRRLCRLGATVPIPSLDRVLFAMVSVLRSADPPLANLPNDAELVSDMIGVLDRVAHVEEDDDPSSSLPHARAELEATLRAALPDDGRLLGRGSDPAHG